MMVVSCQLSNSNYLKGFDVFILRYFTFSKIHDILLHPSWDILCGV